MDESSSSVNRVLDAGTSMTLHLDGHKYRILINPIGLSRSHGKNTVCVTCDDIQLIYQNYFDDVSHIIENPLAWWTMEKL